MSDDASSCKGGPGKLQQRPGLTIMELRIFSCRYIIGSDDDVGANYCGQLAAKIPYCTDHRALCYKAVRPTSPLMPQCGQ